MNVPWEGAVGYGRVTANANTAFIRGVDGKKGKYTYLSGFSYTDSGTQHTITVMREYGRTTLAAALAAAATAVTVAADPGGTGNPMAASDYVAIRLDDGSWHYSTIASSGSTTTLVLTTALPSDRTAPIGAPLIFFGAPGDTFHDNYKFLSNANSSRRDFPPVDGRGPVARGTKTNSPLILYSNNATNAGILEYTNAGYSRCK